MCYVVGMPLSLALSPPVPASGVARLMRYGALQRNPGDASWLGNPWDATALVWLEGCGRAGGADPWIGKPPAAAGRRSNHRTRPLPTRPACEQARRVGANTVAHIESPSYVPLLIYTYVKHALARCLPSDS